MRSDNLNLQFPSELFWKRFKPTPGAISCTEAIAISWLASQAPQGTRIDIGSHSGKSAMAAANGLSKGNLLMVDPVFDLTNIEAWTHSVQGHPNNHGWPYVNEVDFCEKVEENIKIVSAMEVKAKLIGDYSENVIPKYDNYSWVFIDSNDHCDGMAIREVKLLEDKVVKGGIIALHDVGNQFSDPLNAIKYLISTEKYEWIYIPWPEIFNHVRENDLELNNNSWHSSGSEEFPKFVGAVRRK